MAEHFTSTLLGLGTELAFIHDANGIYLSFDWQMAQQYGLVPANLVGQSICEEFGPVVLSPYLERVQRILESLIPERFQYPFRYAEHYFLFDLVVSPLLNYQPHATAVLVMGRLLPHEHKCIALNQTSPEEELLSVLESSGLELHQALFKKIVGIIRRTLPPSSELYQKLLSHITRNIRRTLDLQTICQQTVQGVAQALNVSRCVIYLCNPTQSSISLAAEYCQNGCSTPLESERCPVESACFKQALETLQPIAIQGSKLAESIHQSVLLIATSYQDSANGLIYLYQSDQPRQWMPAELEFIQELAEQVGTALAHATLYKELEIAREQAEEASRLKSEFLANTSHELRTPLNGMLGFLKLILDGMADDPEEQQEFLSEAYRSALHLLNLINDVLDIAKIEAGKMQLEFDPVHLSELVCAVEDLTRVQVQQKNLKFQVHLPHTYDEILVYGNYQRLLQVMLNLVGNAIKFTHEGGVCVMAEVVRQRIKFHNQELPGFVVVRVSDTGIGVAIDKQDRLFKSFSQVDSSRTRQYGGTGLGLAISQKLIEAMGGEVNFYSMGEGLGSTVTFTIPLYQEPVMVCEPESEPIDLLIESHGFFKTEK
jgi:signal transduction histidine kinase